MSKNVKVSIKFYVYSSVKIILLNVMTVFILQLVLLLVQDMTRQSTFYITVSILQHISTVSAQQLFSGHWNLISYVGS